MDELWQRYRTFWTPVLIGLGVFLVGLIVVFVINDDPDDVSAAVSSQRNSLKRLIQPDEGSTRVAEQNAKARRQRVEELGRRLDQAGLAPDVVAEAAAQALQAAILRGGGGADAFDGDASAADSAKRRYDGRLRELVDLLRTGDPNVGFGSIRTDVWNELRVRANRADVDLNADQLGFAAVTSVNRSTLPHRLLNLALVARVVDLAIRSGVKSIDEVRFETRANTGPDSFLQEWPVTVILTGSVDSMRPILAMLTDEQRTTALGDTVLAPPRRQTGGEGIMELKLTMSSVAIRPDAPLDLASEEEDLR